MITDTRQYGLAIAGRLKSSNSDTLVAYDYHVTTGEISVLPLKDFEWLGLYCFALRSIYPS